MNMEKELSLRVTGMTCGSCVRHVTHALTGVPGVADVKVSLQEGTAKVRFEAERVSEDALIAALADAGYEASPAA